jgi:hypothetical protein
VQDSVEYPILWSATTQSKIGKFAKSSWH